MKAQVFLSYEKGDLEKVRDLYQRLVQAGHKPWMDKEDLIAGENWDLRIQQVIRQSDFFLACLSAGSVGKRGFLQKEIKDALDIWREKLDSDIYLIPVRLDDCQVPEGLRLFQWVDLFGEDGLARLLRAIEIGMERRYGPGWREKSGIKPDSLAPTEPVEPIPMSTEEQTTEKGLYVGMVLNGRYVIEKELGRGGIGAVYLARDLQLLSRPVVIKVLLEAAYRDEWIRGKFRQEIEALTRIDHDGVVGVLDAGELPDGKPFLVMEFIEGVTLRSVLKSEGMDLERVARLIQQMGDALGAAHDRGVYHRDLKPENIMLKPLAGGKEQVKLIDFGIAKIKHSQVAESTALPMTAGTIAYMAPEQLMGRPATASSDIYALGVIAYEMVTGRRPFNPDSMFQLLELQRAGIKVKPKDLRPILPDVAQDVILKALAFDPQRRPTQARDFGEELARALTAEVERTEREPEPPEPPVAVSLGERLLQAGVAFLLSLLLGTALIKMLQVQLPPLWILGGVVGVVGVVILLRQYRGKIGRFLPDVPSLRQLWSTMFSSRKLQWVSVPVISGLFTVAAYGQWLDVFPHHWGDWRYQSRPDKLNPDLFLIGIDADTQTALGIPDKSGLIRLRKPHAQLINNLLDLGPPKLICFDLYFADESPDDAEFRRALQRAREMDVPVVVTEFFSQTDASVSRTTSAIADLVVSGQPTITEDQGVVRWLPLVIRRVSDRKSGPFKNIENLPAFILQAALLARAQRPFMDTDLHPGRKIEARDRQGREPRLEVPIDQTLKESNIEYETFLINFPQELERLRRAGPFYRSYKDAVASRPTLVSSDVRGKYILIGLASEPLEESVRIPGNRVAYRSEVHAYAFNTILNESYIRRADPILTPFLISFASVIVFLIGCLLPHRFYWISLIVALSLWMVLLVEVPGLAYKNLDFLWIDAGYLLCAVVTTGVWVLVYRRELWRVGRRTPVLAEETI